MKYAILTFGCRVNQADSLEVDEQLRAAGAHPAVPSRADLVIVNTCSVTATADQGARQAIRRIARENPGARVVVTGCYATRRPSEVASLPSVATVVPNPKKAQLVAMLRHMDWTSAERCGDGEGPCGATIEPGVLGRTAYTLRVQTGCEERCSYCIIPSTRGASISRPRREIVDEVARLAAAGYREVVLTGVHLGSYGRDLVPPTTLLQLLLDLDQVQVDVLFRISSLEPMDCSAAIVDLVSRSAKFAPHFHLPLQHASDRILLAMRRPYTIADYRQLVDDLRRRLPHASIGTDVIVGFPGETDEDAALLTEYLHGSPLTHVHVFPYSDRPGTEASRLPGKVEGGAVRQRARVVRAVSRELANRFRAGQIGSIRPALTLEDGTLAVTDNYLKVRIPPGRPRNERVRVRIVDAAEPMRGEAV